MYKMVKKADVINLNYYFTNLHKSLRYQQASASDREKLRRLQCQEWEVSRLASFLYASLYDSSLTDKNA